MGSKKVKQRWLAGAISKPAFVLGLLSAGLIGAGVGLAGMTSPASTVQDPSAPDTLGRETARGAAEGFLRACRDGDYGRAARYLDFGAVEAGLGADEREDYARQLKVVLDHTLWVDLGRLSDDEGFQPGAKQLLGDVPTEQGDVAARLVFTETEEGATVWLFDRFIVARTPELYAEHGYGWLGEVLPPAFFDVRFLEMELWQWIGLLLLVPIASIAGFLISALLVRSARAVARRSKTEWDDVLLGAVAGPLRFAASVAVFYPVSFVLRPSVPVQRFFAGAAEVLVVVAITWLVLRIIDICAGAMVQKLGAKDPAAAQTLVPMGRRITKIFVGAVAVVSLIHNLGFNVAGLLAGLGVGGLAIALAAQKTLENFFGGVTVIADRPVKVGEFCKVGGDMGTVEDVGLRSTRIRTLDRTLVTIPNAEFSSARIENYAKRDRIRLITTLGLGYDTSPDQMRFVLVEVRKMLYAHTRTINDSCRVRFMNLGAYSLDIEVLGFVDTKDYAEFLGIREDIYLRIMDIVASSGATFAYPSQTLYMGRDGGRNMERTAETEERVRAWREAGQVPLPEFPPDQIAELAGSIDYPPPGSATRGS